MDEKVFANFLIEKRKWTVYVIKAYLFHILHFVHVVEAFNTLDWKILVWILESIF